MVLKVGFKDPGVLERIPGGPKLTRRSALLGTGLHQETYIWWFGVKCHAILGQSSDGGTDTHIFTKDWMGFSSEVGVTHTGIKDWMGSASDTRTGRMREL